ncbi:hypothetical protein LJ655_08935 [Paraburkholderia sp. MMS20-SJTN17]|uniref:Uncharacterized protein n=1 Tax=Paraburkholderia translucens TaxID=2886945 RepID=A0ABS8KB69_9BURK|nr:hypothetical protein [Paraburkholderia sp. MMS20-SJTN17]MCC8402016.1 hypothetical protein [Paraburkholderia sp. MMS20-SJTN17]
MARTGWDIAMRNVDAELDLPKFEASALVRKIAANGFRLPTADRARFQKLPDEVIARLEGIVLEAYLEAGEDVGEEILRENLWQQALISRREMIANGDLITEADFRQRLDLSLRRLGKLLAEGSVFAIEVDDLQYYPALLADPNVDRKRLQAICRIIVPAPPGARLDFLSSRRGSLGDRRPLDMLESDDDFNLLSRLAEAWAAEWSRTSVKMYEGEHETEPKDVDPLYTALAEIDPRRPLWERASEALHVHGYQWPLGPYPDFRQFTLFVERQTAGDATPTPEACVQILVDGEYIRVRIVAAPGTALDSETVPADKHKTFLDVAKQVIAHLWKR